MRRTKNVSRHICFLVFLLFSQSQKAAEALNYSRAKVLGETARNISIVALVSAFVSMSLISALQILDAIYKVKGISVNN